MSDSKKPNLEDMSIEELAALDLEADKTKDVNAGPLLKIKVPRGSNALFISDISDHPEEIEVLIARGARFQVIGVSDTGYGRKIVELLLLP